MGKLIRRFNNIMFIAFVLSIAWTFAVISSSDHSKIIAKAFQDKTSLQQELSDEVQRCIIESTSRRDASMNSLQHDLDKQVQRCKTDECISTAYERDFERYTSYRRDFDNAVQRCTPSKSTSDARHAMIRMELIKSIILGIWESGWGTMCKDLCEQHSLWSLFRWYTARTCQLCDNVKNVYLALLSTTWLWLAAVVVAEVLPTFLLTSIPVLMVSQAVWYIKGFGSEPWIVLAVSIASCLLMLVAGYLVLSVVSYLEMLVVPYLDMLVVPYLDMLVARVVAAVSAHLGQAALKDARTAQTKDYTCPICLDPVRNPVTTDCQHEFCSECLATWLQGHNTCPCCRAVVSNVPEAAGLL